jgi:peptidyl-prolyl cis-trans isomerase D
MFDFVRKHTRVMQLLLFLLIVPSFVLFGLEGYSRFREKGASVARVDGQDITQAEWDNAHKQEVDRVRQQAPGIDAKLLDSAEARYGTLERLVRDRVLAAAAAKGNLLVSDARLARELMRNEALAPLRMPDGRLDLQKYQQLLAAQGMSPERFENTVRAEIGERQVLAGVGASSFASPAQANVALASFFERREIQVARFGTGDFQAKVEPTEAELEAYYKANPQRFQAPEQASIEYVVLDLESVTRGISLNEQDLKAYFDQNQGRVVGIEERRASHILIAAPKGAPAADREKAKARAEELLAQARKAPEKFADLARANSQDAGSAKQGGDLDFFARGAMPKPFEDAAFALKKGELSPVVETDLGFHIIRLTDLKLPKQRTFEEVRPQLESELKKQQAQRKYAESAESFSNTVYEQSDSLKPVADKLKLEVKTAANISRRPQPGAAGPLASQKFLDAVFSPDAVERKRNTEALEFGPNQMVSGRIAQYTPSRTRPFAEVRAQVRERVVAERAAELAKKEGQAKLVAWKAAPASAALGAPVAVSRQSVAAQPQPVIDAALRADGGALPAWVGVDLGADGYAVIKVNKVLPREAPPPGQMQQEMGQYARAWAAAETIAYYNMLKERFKVEINVPKPKEAPPGR